MKKLSKYVRTTITNPNGTISRARINLNTGEVTKFGGKQAMQIKSRPKANAGDLEPFWMSSTFNQQVAEDVRPTVPTRKSIDNPYYGMLDDFAMYEMKGDSRIVCSEEELDEDGLNNQIASLIDNMPFVDNYLTCVSQLGDKNILSKNVLFSLLKRLPEINSNTIYQSTNYSIGHCQRLAAALRVFIKLTT